MTAPACSVFGRIVLGSDVERWVIDHCRKWISTYMSEAERQHGLPELTYQRPRSYVRGMAFDAWPEDQVPRLIFASPGMATPPQKGGDGVYTASWVMGFGAHYAAATPDGARDGAQLLTGAVRELMLEKPSLGGHALASQWADERYDDLPFDDQRSHSSGQAHFNVAVANVGQWLAGPVDPDLPSDLPWAEWPQVDEVDTVVVNSPVS